MPSKVLPLAQHRILDGVHILSGDPVDPVVRGFSRAQLEGLEESGREEEAAQDQ